MPNMHKILAAINNEKLKQMQVGDLGNCCAGKRPQHDAASGDLALCLLDPLPLCCRRLHLRTLHLMHASCGPFL